MKYRLNMCYGEKAKRLFLVSCLLIFTLGSGCKRQLELRTGPDENGIDSSQTNGANTVNIIADTNFVAGVGIQGTSSDFPDIEEVIYPFGKKSSTPSEPSWTLPQWHSKYDLEGVAAKNESNGSVTYENAGKKVNFWHTDGTTQVTMEIFGSKEYAAPRKFKEDWPALFIQQTFDQRKVYLKNLKALNFKMQARLMYVENKMSASDYNTSLHTVQYAIHFTIPNLNKNSPDYGDYFWFGISIYDYRYVKTITSWSADNLGSTGGTGKFIYTIGSENLFDGDFTDKKWRKISIDILPYLKKAFKQTRESGYMQNTNFDDLTISGSMNIGYELPGTFDAGVEAKGISLTAILSK